MSVTIGVAGEEVSGLHVNRPCGMGLVFSMAVSVFSKVSEHLVIIQIATEMIFSLHPRVLFSGLDMRQLVNESLAQRHPRTYNKLVSGSKELLHNNSNFIKCVAIFPFTSAQTRG